MANQVTAAEQGEATAHTEEAAPAEPTALGLDANGWSGIAMLVVIGIMLWRRVPAMVAGALDKRIAAIRGEIDEAAGIRAEAEALRAEYEAKTANADDEAKALLDRAKEEANMIVAQAGEDADALIRRRGRLAEAKIAAAERSAIAEVRAKATSASIAAAAALIAQKHDASADEDLVDKTIAGLDSRIN